MRRLPACRLAPLFAALLLLGAPDASAASLVDWWLTPDQQAQRLEARGQHAEAAERYVDPLRRGVAFYRAGEFEAAADAFGRVATPEAAFNRGNALVMRGLYDDAIASYGLALEQRPAWREAQQNLELARVRKERREVKSDEYQGTDGMLAADEIVYDETGERTAGGQEQADDSSGGMGAAEVEALWMRRLQTSPGEFLRAKFAAQLSAAGAAGDQ